MPSKVRFGIIGTGAIAHDHAIAINSLKGVAELVTCVDIDREKATAFALQHKIQRASTFDKPLSLLHSGSIDAVCICTPPPTHADLSIQAARNSINVLCEKPMATILSDADTVLEAVKDTGITYSVVSQRRWLPAAQAVKEAVASGKLGCRIIMADVITENYKSPFDIGRADWRKTWRGAGGGVLINQCPHSIDLLLWYMGKPTEVFGYCRNFTHPEMEMEDNLVAVIRFASGSIATLTASITVNPTLRDHQIMLFGDSGHRISLDIRNFSEGSNDIWTPEDPPNVPKTLSPNLHTYQIEDFIAAIQEDRSPSVTAEDSRLVTAVINGIYSSSLCGRSITIGG